MDPHVLLSDWLRTVFPAGPPLPVVVPPFLLPDQEGWLTSSEEMQARGPYVLSFFHGSWCPTCLAKLGRLEAGLDGIHRQGAGVVACSPETRGFPRTLKSGSALRLSFLSDVDCSLSVDLGLAFAVPEKIRVRLEEMNIDLGERQGDGRWLLPIPVTLVVGRRGEVIRIFTTCGLDLDVAGIVAALVGLQRQKGENSSR
jgi:peroxiredoxin